MAYTFNPFTGTFDYYEPAPQSFVAPYQTTAVESVTVIDRNVLALAAMYRLDGELKLDGMMVSD